MTESFLELAAQRRTIYALGKNVNLSNDQLEALIKEAVKQAPTAFNNQTTRAVILFNDKHDAFWNIVFDKLSTIVEGEEALAATKAKIDSFKAGYATVLFFTETAVVKQFEELAPLYADNFYDWSEQGMGIANYATWLALTEAGLGASLQHYNPIVDAEVSAEFDIPAEWRLRSQLVLGSIEAPAGEKEFVAEDERFRVLGK
ncbi:nitroreductase family protein [Periweissella fabaria]|uniref:Nitroreductase domain-containing protein n=1 Tax=Periweissella fabaria TaxID=546157 RepID=A0ABM8Z3N5_9LACO|nr:nitroreductase family protein [Periweissella fabaria]MCM0596510.1 nitroreductase family protein [Periweissella fabaria]CAH0415761.1 hypothetical protein WFA24289_00058 [Periweissella fabaria]